MPKYFFLAVLFSILNFQFSILNCSAQQTDTIIGSSSDLVLPSMRPFTIHNSPDTLQKTEFHLSMGTGIVGNKYYGASAFGITPQFIYRPNDRLTLNASVSVLNSYSLYDDSPAYVRGHEPRDLSPRRNPGGETAASIALAATYRVGKNLWLGASVMHIGGTMASSAFLNPWFSCGQPVELNATAVTAAMRYKFSNNSYLDFHATFINDRTGALGPLYFGGPYGSPYGSLFGNPYGTPFGSQLFY